MHVAVVLISRVGVFQLFGDVAWHGKYIYSVSVLSCNSDTLV